MKLLIFNKQSTPADLQALISAIQTGQVVMMTGERSLFIGGNVSNSVIVAGDNNQVALLPEAAAIALETMLQQY